MSFIPSPFCFIGSKIRRQPRSVVRDRKQHGRGRGLDTEDDVARRIFHRIGDRLGDQKAERYSKRGRQRYLRALDDDRPPGTLLQQQVRDIDAQRAQVLLELDVLLTIEESAIAGARAQKRRHGQPRSSADSPPPVSERRGFAATGGSRSSAGCCQAGDRIPAPSGLAAGTERPSRAAALSRAGETRPRRRYPSRARQQARRPAEAGVRPQGLKCSRVILRPL